MGISQVQVSESHERLLAALGETIQRHTAQSPMPVDQIIGVLAFTTGAAIGQIKDRSARREVRKMAEANMDNGTQLITGVSGLILPGGLQ